MIHYMKYMPCRRHGRRSHRIRKDEVEAFLDEFTTFLSRLPHVYEQLRLNLNQFTQALEMGKLLIICFQLLSGHMGVPGGGGGSPPPPPSLLGNQRLHSQAILAYYKNKCDKFRQFCWKFCQFCGKYSI
jgi:hypothetical protein